MVAALLALLSSVLWGTGDFIGGTASKRLHALAVVGVSQLAGLVGILAYAAVAGELTADPSYIPWAVAAGLISIIGLGAFYAALASGTMGVVAPLASLGVAVPVVVGLAQGDKPSALQLGGIFVALVGVVLASGPELRGGGAGPRPLLLAVAAGVCFGSFFVLVAEGSKSSAAMTLVAMRASSVPVIAAIGLLARTMGGVTRADIPLLAVVGLADVGANLAFGIASRSDYLSVVAVLGSLYPVVTALLARAIHGERMRHVQVGGVAAAVAGVVLIAAG